MYTAVTQRCCHSKIAWTELSIWLPYTGQDVSLGSTQMRLSSSFLWEQGLCLFKVPWLLVFEHTVGAQ